MANPNPTGIEAYKPAEIEAMVEAAGVAKANMPLRQMGVLAVLAGAYIALGATAYLMTMTGADPGFGPTRFLGGLVFSMGLILVVIAGAELFTGNALMIIAAVDRKITLRQLLRAWLVVYVGNFIGALGIAILLAPTGLLDGAFGATARAAAEAKATLDWQAALSRGILCNALVCLAVWIALAARTVAGKILAILWPISAFVLLGFEHSVANMFFLPLGLLAGAEAPLTGIAHNLVLVTLGNIIGGAGGVAVSYRLAYGLPESR